MGVALGVGVATGLAATLITDPFTGGVVGIATGFVLRNPKFRQVVSLVAAACVFAAGAYITIHQGIEPNAPNGGWPVGFALAGSLVWAGVMLLGADAVTEVVLQILERRHGERGAPVDPSPPVS